MRAGTVKMHELGYTRYSYTANWLERVPRARRTVTVMATWVEAME